MTNAQNGVLQKGHMQTFLGKMTAYQRDGELIMRGTTPTKVNNPQTAAQMYHRLRLPNLVSFYRVVRKFNKKGWENLPPKTSLYNCFVGANMDIDPLGIRKQEFGEGLTLVEAYQITEGSLPAVVVDVWTRGAAKGISNIYVGEMEITSATKVGELAQAVVEGNGGEYRYGDEIAFLLAEQYMVDGVARVRAKRMAVNLIKDSTDTLGDMNLIGWGVENGLLAINGTAPIGGYCWVHSRKDEDNGQVKVSTQRMIVVDGGLLALYRSPEMMRLAAEDQGAEFDEKALLECHGTDEKKVLDAFGLKYQIVRNEMDSNGRQVEVLIVQYGEKRLKEGMQGVSVNTASEELIQIGLSGCDKLDTEDVSVDVNGVACTEVQCTQNGISAKLPASLNGQVIREVVVKSGDSKSGITLKV